MIRTAAALALALLCFGQSRTMKQGPHRMEITLERLESDSWRAIDPGLVLAQGDRVRFRYHTNFDGYLYVTNMGTSGRYEQLFPREETGQDNRVAASTEYQVPATNTAFRIAGPAGHDIVYWMVSPAPLNEGAPLRPKAPQPAPAAPKTLIPRCDDSILRARGDCVDPSAGPKLIPRDAQIPENLADAAGRGARDLVFMQEGKAAVISSPAPLTGPVIYEFRLAHK
ncbi:MAG TPA: DUF4384 domain-containing protein [Candidatus Acidoferrales bacterium]|nr:DUF4384 domain-containing protein [Candidatus Acidoferrales bacterium]